MTNGLAPTLTARQKQLIRQSFDSAREYSTSLTKLFYGRLFNVAPHLRALFKISLEEQSRKLLDMLASIVDAIDRVDELRPRLVELGRKHVDYGVKPEHYDLVRVSLLWALAQALERGFDAETKSAWDQMLRTIAGVMLEEQVPRTPAGDVSGH
jgi:nitric oxide dioxygenase